MREEYADIAEEIVIDKLTNLMNEYSITKDRKRSIELKKKIDVLQKIKEEIYSGSQRIIKMVIKNKMKGIK